ncbi:MAG: protein yceA [Gammaproteobacteria bacterium]|nr:protein yceA [Gammaproteobacteria bacterium]
MMKSEAAPKPVLNIAAYQFVAIDELVPKREALREKCNFLQLKGSILLSEEGINLFLAGCEEAIRTFLDYLYHNPLFKSLNLHKMAVKESWSQSQPFSRMLVKLKKEIIPLGKPGIKPHEHTAPVISPFDLKRWLDEGKDFTLLDTRNDYEVRLGSFEKALVLDLQHFRDFPEVCQTQLAEDTKVKPLVMFCTGGIRCEKASVVLEQQGFKEVYQLEGGILNYFEQCGGVHYRGECFVFDKRVAVDPALAETATVQCYRCQNPLSVAQQHSEWYVPNVSCPYCAIKQDAA